MTLFFILLFLFNTLFGMGELNLTLYSDQKLGIYGGQMNPPAYSGEPREEFKARYWLPMAAWQGNLDKVKEYVGILGDQNLNKISQFFPRLHGPAFTPIQAAVIQGNENVVEYLLQRNKDLLDDAIGVSDFKYRDWELGQKNNSNARLWEQAGLRFVPDWLVKLSNEINPVKNPDASFKDDTLPLLFLAVLGDHADVAQTLINSGALSSIMVNGKPLSSYVKSEGKARVLGVSIPSTSKQPPEQKSQHQPKSSSSFPVNPLIDALKNFDAALQDALAKLF